MKIRTDESWTSRVVQVRGCLDRLSHVINLISALQESNINDDYCIKVLFYRGEETVATSDFSGNEIIINLSGAAMSIDVSVPIVQSNFEKGPVACDSQFVWILYPSPSCLVQNSDKPILHPIASR